VRVPRKRIAGLDAIRGLAILLVMVCHAFYRELNGAGPVGVTVFFALSGYLITGIVVSEIQTTSKVSFFRFYRNRVLRLGPALACLLLVFVLVEEISNRLGDKAAIARSTVIGVTYTADLPKLHNEVSAGLAQLW
jgi:peptidoglycan/LPS O-acetylase OafA/YrhL